MAGYISDGNSDFNDGMKWVIVPPHKRLTREQHGDLIYDAGEDIFDLNVPLYKRVPLDDPRPEAPDPENGGNASHAAG